MTGICETVSIDCCCFTAFYWAYTCKSVIKSKTNKRFRLIFWGANPVEILG